VRVSVGPVSQRPSTRAPRSQPPRAIVRHESTGLSLGTRDKLRVGLLSGVAGFVDAAAFLSFFGLFPAHVTGELVTEALALSSGGSSSSTSRLWMLPVFVAAVAVAACVARLRRRASKPALAAMLLLVGASLAAFSLTGAALVVLPGLSDWLATLSGCCAVAAMGFQNALMREALNGSAPTTFMTGNLTQLVIELVDHGFVLRKPISMRGDVERAVSRARLRTAGTALLAFLSGAVLGGVLTRSAGPLSAALPCLVVLGMCVQAFREQRVQAPVAVAAPRSVGLRRPTPIHHPLDKLLRPHSGTRFKAVRPVEDSEREESA
jgi:uncharacterized membrane protein YoaK (UPF0700 family)